MLLSTRLSFLLFSRHEIRFSRFKVGSIWKTQILQRGEAHSHPRLVLPNTHILSLFDTYIMSREREST